MIEDGGEIEVWGDGSALRVYTYIDDLCDGIYTLMQSDITEPTNVGSTELTTVNELVATVAAVAGKTVKVKHIDGPVGVQARYHEINRLMATGWKPRWTVEKGIRETYPWIEEQVKATRLRKVG
jgi:nucleoside-diphosphate-sugar epimerase